MAGVCPYCNKVLIGIQHDCPERIAYEQEQRRLRQPFQQEQQLQPQEKTEFIPTNDFFTGQVILKPKVTRKESWAK